MAQAKSLLQPVQTLGNGLVGFPQYGACSRLWKKWHEATSTQATLPNLSQKLINRIFSIPG